MKLEEMTYDLYINVILPLRVDGAFTYSVPDEWKYQVAVGKRVVVQFGQRKIYTALIIGIHTKKPSYSVKPIISVLDDKPIVTSNQLLLWEWISRYYLSSLGEVMKAALPTALKLESESVILPGLLFEHFNPVSKDEELIKDLLIEKGYIVFNDLQNKLNQKTIHPIVNRLFKNQYIFIEETLSHKYTPKKVDYVDLYQPVESDDHANKLFEKLSKAKKQSDVLISYFALNNSQYDNTVPIRKDELLKTAHDSGGALKALLEKKILKIIVLEESRVFTKLRITKLEKFPLLPAQEEAKNKILQSFEKSNVVLLHGVTSSGKTEIYIHLIEDVIRQGKQVLYLLPEIALTSQIVQRLRKALGDRVAVYHSMYSDAERAELYLHMATATEPISVIVGVRSSIFLPFNNLGLIIIDEEHEPTFKQQSPEPRYHARDAAIVMAKFYNAKVLLGSATPSIESYFNAISGKYALVELMQRFGNIELPELQIINIRDERKKKKVHLDYYSDILIRELKKCISEKKQAILFQNRRGYSPYLECENCGWIPECNYCDVKLTYHKNFKKLVCHYCGFSMNVPSECQECHHSALKIKGIGTERIDDELRMLIPEARVARMDLDTTRTRNKIEQLLNAIESQQIDILVGTQMVTKGLDFENITLIGIIDADTMLNFPDFRANERSFQLFYQVSGRSGRKFQRGKIMIQTAQPQNTVLQYLQNNDFKGFVNWQLSERKQFKYPPYVRLIKITLKSKDPIKVKVSSKELANQLRKSSEYMVIGPQSPLIARIQSYYLMEIWLKLPHTKESLKQRDEVYIKLHSFFSLPENKSLKWLVDVDPM
jgi:primosomal protein N' (replication factor Y)